MAPILYHTDISPPGRAVLLTASALGIDLNVKEVDIFAKQHLKPEFLKINPQHTVPTLDDNGFVVRDSHGIVAYLVDNYGSTDPLYSRDLQKRAIVNQRMNFDCGILFPSLKAVYGPILFNGKKQIPEGSIDGMIQAYAFLEAFLEGHSWLAGDQMTVADMSALATVSSAVPVIPIDSTKFPQLAAWYKLCTALRYYDKFNAGGAKKIADIVINNITQ